MNVACVPGTRRSKSLGLEVGEYGVKLSGSKNGMSEQKGMIRTFGTDSETHPLSVRLKLFGACLKE